MVSGCASFERRPDPAPVCVEPVRPASLIERCEMPEQYPDSKDVDVLVKTYLQLRADYRALCGKYNASLTVGSE